MTEFRPGSLRLPPASFTANVMYGGFGVPFMYA